MIIHFSLFLSINFLLSFLGSSFNICLCFKTSSTSSFSFPKSNSFPLLTSFLYISIILLISLKFSISSFNKVLQLSHKLLLFIFSVFKQLQFFSKNNVI